MKYVGLIVAAGLAGTLVMSGGAIAADKKDNRMGSERRFRFLEGS